MNKMRCQIKLRHQPLALAVIMALLSPLAQAATSENTAGVISGHQIQLTGTPTLSGTGVAGSELTVTLPGTSDADNDQLADWRYQWRQDGIAIGSETDAGSATAIPAYTVEAIDAGKAITLCLKALADKGYPLATKTSNEVCSNAVTGQASMVNINNPGAQQVNENALYSVVLTGTNNNPVKNNVWTLGGADAGSFTLTPGVPDADSVTLSMVARDFEVPGDNDGNNRYDVSVTLSDNGSSFTRKLAVNVVNLVETLLGTTSVSNANPVANDTDTARVELLLKDDTGAVQSGQSVTIESDKGTLTATSATTDAQGKVSVAIRHNLAEAATLTFHWTGLDGLPASTTQVVTFVAGDLSVVSLVDGSGNALPTPLTQGIVLHNQTQLVGETALVLDRSGLTYQWQRQDLRSGQEGGWSDIVGATQSTYTTTAADQGYQFRLIATKP